MVKKTILKQVKGPNEKAYNCTKADRYFTKTKHCKHKIAPSNKLTYNCGGTLVFNIYQHQTICIGL